MSKLIFNSCELRKGSYKVAITLNVLSEPSCYTQKRPYFVNVLRGRPVVFGRKLVRVRLYAVTADNKTEELNLALNKLTFLHLCVKLIFTQSSNKKMLEMLFLTLTEDHNVVLIY